MEGQGIQGPSGTELHICSEVKEKGGLRGKNLEGWGPWVRRGKAGSTGVLETKEH